MEDLIEPTKTVSHEIDLRNNDIMTNKFTEWLKESSIVSAFVTYLCANMIDNQAV